MPLGGPQDGRFALARCGALASELQKVAFFEQPRWHLTDASHQMTSRNRQKHGVQSDHVHSDNVFCMCTVLTAVFQVQPQ